MSLAARRAADRPAGHVWLRRPRLTKRRRQEALWFYLFVSPWIIGFLVFQLGPMLSSLYLSMTDWDSFTPPKWVGLDNYKTLLTKDPVFWKSLGNTFYYAGLSVPLGLLIGLWLANLLNKRIRGRRIFRTLIYLPALVPLVATAMIFKIVLAPSGPLNRGLGLFGIHGPDWLLSETWIKPALVLLSVWGAGGSTVLLLAAMKGIPKELYEAAEMDGAGPIRQFWSVTVPQLTPIIFFNLVMGLIAAFQMFSQTYVLAPRGQRGGPNYASETMVLYLFDHAFGFYHVGYAAALSWLLFLVILGFTILAFRTARRWVFYESEVK